MTEFTRPIAGLLAGPPAPLPYIAGVVVRSFVLERSEGALAIYNSPGLGAAVLSLEQSKRPGELYLNHAHEEMYGNRGLDLSVHVHERDRGGVARTFPAVQSFDGRRLVGGDFEVIPTPGHTPGTTTYLWDSGEHCFLFVGDTIWVEHGQWSAVVLDGAARADYLDSLRLMRDLDFDVLVPWGAYDDEPVIHEVSPAEREERLTAIIERVEAGGSR